MRAYQEQDFEKMATRVVERFMRGEKLADVAAMEAHEGQLNPDQIERLVQAANTMAFLQLMERQKAQGTPDMTGEFDPIDARQVMQNIVGQVPDVGTGPGGPGSPEGHPGMGTHPAMSPMSMPPHGEPDGDEAPLPDEMGLHDLGGDEPEVPTSPADSADDNDDNDGPFPKGEKQKTKDDASKKDKPKPKKEGPEPPKKDEAKEAAFRQRRMRKLADVLDDQLKQAELAFEDEFSRLSTLLRRAHGAPNACAFEKDALARHGDNIGVVVLGLVQESRGWPVTSHGDAQTKTASLADRHLVDDTEANRSFDVLVKIAAEAARLKQGAEFARTRCS